MIRRWQPPDPIGLSVIDLLCCAFVAVYVLNLQLVETSKGEADRGTHHGHAHAITADLEANLSAPPPIGIRLTLGAQEAWSTRPEENIKVTWSVSPRTTRAFLAGSIPSGSGIDVFLLEPPGGNEVVRVMLSFGGGRRFEVKLGESNYFRGHASLPEGP
jgi:hypothetical protein